MKNYAFTLAEVLITLAIIGIVAAMTIPSIVQQTQKQEYVSALKKTYSVISQATNMIITEEGGTPDKWGMINENDASTNKIMELYKTHLLNLKVCDTSDSSCNYSDNLLNINGNISQIQTTYGGNWGVKVFKWKLSDGASISFDMWNYSNFINYFGLNPGYTDGLGYGMFIVDVNGNKKPNQLGRDVFIFCLTNKGLAPAGRDNNSANCSTSTSSVWGGADCAAKVLTEGAMNY